VHSKLQRILALQRPHLDRRMARLGADEPGVTLLVHPLHARGGAQCEEIAQVIPVIGRAIGEGERYLVTRVPARWFPALPAQLPRRPPIRLLERIVEAAQAAEPGGERDLGHRQIALVDQPLGEVQAARLRHRER
jgi:hypothetical protein